MKTISLQDAKSQLPRLVKGLSGGPVVLTVGGRPRAALVALPPGFDSEIYSLSNNRRLRELIESACRSAQEEGIPFSQVEAEVVAREKRRRKRASRRSL